MAEAGKEEIEKIAKLVRVHGVGRDLGIEEEIVCIVDRRKLAPKDCSIAPSYLVLARRKRRVGSGFLVSLYYADLGRGALVELHSGPEPEFRDLAEKILGQTMRYDCRGSRFERVCLRNTHVSFIKG